MVYNLFPKLHVRHKEFSFYGPRKSDEGADTDLIFASLILDGRDSKLNTQLNKYQVCKKNLTLGNRGLGHVNNHTTMKFFTGISRNTQSKSSMLDFAGIDGVCLGSNALWDAHYHALCISRKANHLLELGMVVTTSINFTFTHITPEPPRLQIH